MNIAVLLTSGLEERDTLLRQDLGADPTVKLFLSLGYMSAVFIERVSESGERGFPP